jgi:hypothetical protein
LSAKGTAKKKSGKLKIELNVDDALRAAVETPPPKDAKPPKKRRSD